MVEIERVDDLDVEELRAGEVPDVGFVGVFFGVLLDVAAGAEA